MRAWGRLSASATLAAIAVALVAADPAAARDDIVESFDGEEIVTTFFPAKGLDAGDRAPTVLVGHGWGVPRERDKNSETLETFGLVGLGPLREAGYNVLTWDARGFGGSGGTVMVDAPDFEARDVKKLISYVADQPEAKRDDPGDPRVGLAGGSYGGGIQLNTAAKDERIDAIVPDIAWNSLITSLFEDRSVKAGWGSILYGLGVPTSIAPGLVSPGGLQTGNLDPHITSAFTSGLATGDISEEDRDWFRSRGPGDRVKRIEAPTLLVQGTVDTLFTPDEAETNYRMLRNHDVPVKMLWFCGGHGVCLTDSGKTGLVEEATLDWFARYLKRKDVGTGARFRWIADDGKLRRASDYPIERKDWLVATGDGPLPVAAAPTSGELVAGGPAASAVNVSVPAPDETEQLVGEPKLKLEYSGTAAPARTHLYAQIVDLDRGTVIGNQVTPIPVRLDGQDRVVERGLEPIAETATEDSSYRLQIVAASNVFGPQRSAGAADISKARIKLPVVDP